MPNISPQGIRQFRKKILSFYAKRKRDLPWRRTADPYAILLSEVMLQQTQVDRVIVYYNKWLRKWPTIHNLANAERASVLREWLGLGYNNRARNLHETAKIISGKHRGDVLAALKQYKELPGIGPYTSRAVRIFSTNEGIITVDTNIRRILIHEFGLDEKITDRQLGEVAEKCCPKGKGREWHNALMDYGATFLTSRRTGIRPKTSQGRFEGSDRQIRSKVLRLLLSKGKISFDELKKELRMIVECSGVRLRRILGNMEADALIRQRNGKYIIDG